MKTIDEVYAEMTYKQAEHQLQLIGGICEAARILGRSLTADQRNTILSVREKACILGMSVNMQNTIEMEGAAIVRESLKS